MDRPPRSLSASVLGVVVLAATHGCVGAIDEKEGSSPPAMTAPQPSTSAGASTSPTGAAGATAPGGATTSTTTPGSPAAPVVVSGFTVPFEQLRVLPYAVRFGRVVAVTGAPATDPIFELLRTNRTLLGDHDFATGVKPDSTWSALRMSEWVRAVKPVCASAAMRAKYAALPANLGPLVEAAYGRAARADDTAAVKDALAGLTLDEKAQYQAICVAVLSSLEFLAQ
jgi:hypothetical protein